MSTSSNTPQNEGQYHIEIENAAEMARLTKQGRMAIELVGLFPEPLVLPSGSRLLDIGCGPGVWVLDVARTAPDCQITGIDLSHLMLEHAQSQAMAKSLPNAFFQVMDAHQPLAFADATFDFVHLSAVTGFLSPTSWPKVLQECFRVLRPNGIIESIEAENMGVITTPALARFQVLLMRAVRQVGQCFTPEGPEYGITAMQKRLLKKAGFTRIKGQASVLDYSAGTLAHPVWYDNYQAMMKLTQPFLVASGVSTQDELERICEQALEEMRRDDFCAVTFIQSVWGTKPQAD